MDEEHEQSLHYKIPKALSKSGLKSVISLMKKYCSVETLLLLRNWWE